MTGRARVPSRLTGAWTLVLLAALGASSCLDAADGRAARDLEVGHATAGALRVGVTDGLASVQRLAPGELALWAQAPVLSARLKTADAAGPWTVAVDNALPDALLSARGPDGAALAVTCAPAAIPTEKRCRVDLPADAEVALELAPADRDERAPWRFALFADVQERIDDVQDIYTLINQQPDLRFCLISGDLTKRGSPAELARFKAEMKTLTIPCFPTLGNHELGTREDLFHEHFGRGSFSFTFRGVRFTLIDSASATVAPAVYQRLDAWLAAGRDSPHLVMMHIPPLDPAGFRNGAFASRAEANMLIGRLAAANVDLTVYGHIHSYYEFTNAGIPAYISGGGGSFPEAFDGIGRHFMVVDVDPSASSFRTRVVRVD